MLTDQVKIPESAQELNQFLDIQPDKIEETQNDPEVLWKAYQFVLSALRMVEKPSEQLIQHDLGVTRILAGMSFDLEMLAAALLHDVMDKSGVLLKDIETEFGPAIAQLVDGVQKLSKYDTAEKRDANAIRKLFLAMTSDVRVILIKLADRAQYIRTMETAEPDPERRKRIATETLDIYASIAERLGTWRIKSELEDLSFKVLQPKEYNEIYQNLERSKEEHAAVLQRLITAITEKLLQNGFKEGEFEVSGRRKHIYSIYKKLKTPKYEGLGIERVYDKIGVRIIVQTVQDCYTALGLVHSEWSPVPGEFDDYIGMRLPSGYQSLHTTVKYGPNNGDIMEFQIRTYKMHQDAEYGVAAHWIYKEKAFGKRDVALERKVAWLRQTLEEPQSEDAESFVSALKADALPDRVYAFTPKGDIIDLPLGATPIDFAYQVHTNVGHRTRGAKVNGKLVTLDYQLKNGDIVEIITAKQGGPSRDWLNPNLGMVKSQRTRGKIKQWFKQQDRDQNLAQGKIMVEREIRRLNVALTEADLMAIARDFQYLTVDDLYVGVGSGDLSIGKIINRISEIEKARQEQEEVLEAHPSTETKSSSTAVNVLGLKGLLTTFARCCNPAPGDEIVGYITRGRGATIHRTDCPNILRMTDRERMVKVTWGEAARTFPVSVRIKAYDRQGLMGDISTILNNENINLLDINLKVSQNWASINLMLEVRDIEQLSRVLTRIEALPNVKEAVRNNPG